VWTAGEVSKIARDRRARRKLRMGGMVDDSRASAAGHRLYEAFHGAIAEKDFISNLNPNSLSGEHGWAEPSGSGMRCIRAAGYFCADLDCSRRRC
jgi:hypothetical protein